jgi:hypothetical protein
MAFRRPVVATLASAVLATTAVAAASMPAEAARKTATSNATVAYAPASSAAIHPGTMMYTDGAQCTANFVYTDSAANTYVGYAAHCAGTGGATSTNGCDTGSLPLGTKVDFVDNGSVVSSGTTVGTGTLVYSSWLTMQKNGTTDPDTCAYNDLALVKVDPQYVSTVNPSIPFWGGPTGVSTTGTTAGDDVFSYGNSSLRAGIEVLKPKQGKSLGDDGNGWSHTVYTVTPGIPGDSGSAFLDKDGKALGVLSTVAIAPLAGSNGVGDIAKELAYAQQYSGISGLTLVNGTEPFKPLL